MKIKIKEGDIYTVVPFKKLPSTKAWKLTSELVRRTSSKEMSDSVLKDFGVCYTCGVVKPIRELVAGHFRDKWGGAAGYFDLDNIRCQCFRCNKLMHGNKDIYAYELRKEIGLKRFNNLFLKGQQSKQWTKWELNQIAEQRKAMLDALTPN